MYEHAMAYLFTILIILFSLTWWAWILILLCGTALALAFSAYCIYRLVRFLRRRYCTCKTS
jgi:hypothetical protein